MPCERFTHPPMPIPPGTMPELPEVEVVRAGLERGVAGRVIVAVHTAADRTIRRHPAGLADFVDRLVGRRIVGADRRGKYLWLPLDSEEALLGHLGMSGQLLVSDPAAPHPLHLRARICFADGGPELRFVDQRTFGGLAVEVMGEGRSSRIVPESVRHIAPDPLEPSFSTSEVRSSLKRRRTGIKRALLDQGLVSGIGNIYADEALWRAKLHFARPTETLTTPEANRLLAGVDDVLRAALAAGGTTFDGLYVAVNGASGYFDRELAVYGRQGQACHRCASQIRREAFMNRSSHYCPRCQPVPRRGRW